MSVGSLAESTARSKASEDLLRDRRPDYGSSNWIMKFRARSIQRRPRGGITCRHTQKKNLKRATFLRKTRFGWPSKGDAAAFERIYRRYSRRVYSLWLRIVKNDGEAEDLTTRTRSYCYSARFAHFEVNRNFPPGCTD